MEQIRNRLYPNGYERWIGSPPDTLDTSWFQVEGLSICMRKDDKDNVIFYMLPPNQIHMRVLFKFQDEQFAETFASEFERSLEYGIPFCKTHLGQFIDFIDYGKWLYEIRTSEDDEQFAFMSFILNDSFRPLIWDPNGRVLVGEIVNRLDDYRMVLEMQLFGDHLEQPLVQIGPDEFRAFDEQIKAEGKEEGRWETKFMGDGILEIQYDFSIEEEAEYKIRIIQLPNLANKQTRQHFQNVFGYTQVLGKRDFVQPGAGKGLFGTKSTMLDSVAVPLLWARQVARIISTIIMSFRPRTYERGHALVSFMRYLENGDPQSRKDEESAWQDRIVFWNTEKPSLQLQAFLKIQDRFRQLANRNFLSLSDAQVMKMEDLMAQMKMARRLNVNGKCDWCNNVATHVCGSCNMAAYCSKSCFRSHKHQCSPTPSPSIEWRVERK